MEEVVGDIVVGWEGDGGEGGWEVGIVGDDEKGVCDRGLGDGVEELGRLGVGIGEFRMMGILGYVGGDLKMGIGVGGDLIWGYGVGVCAGGGMLILGGKGGLKDMVVGLMGLMVVGKVGGGMGRRENLVGLRG